MPKIIKTPYPVIEPPKITKIGYRLTNICARIAGVGFSIISLIFLSCGVLNLALSGLANGDLALISASGGMFVFGILLIKIKPYYPHMYKRWFEKIK